MKIRYLLVFVFCLTFFAFNNAFAHFGMLIPSQTNVMESKKSTIDLNLKFWHPFKNKGMNLEKPAIFAVYYDGKAHNLLSTLTEQKEQGLMTWQSQYTIKRPGLYAFVMEPKPYFEKEEDTYIVHITKTYVSAFGGDDNWDKPLGLKAEIVPLTDPNALYAGNTFQGKVLLNGKPVPNATVEVEWYPGENLAGQAPYENMITQRVKTNDLGILTFTAPHIGWVGFAALLNDGTKIAHDGKEVEVELGAVMWVYFYPLLPVKTIVQ